MMNELDIIIFLSSYKPDEKVIRAGQEKLIELHGSARLNESLKIWQAMVDAIDKPEDEFIPPPNYAVDQMILRWRNRKLKFLKCIRVLYKGLWLLCAVLGAVLLVQICILVLGCFGIGIILYLAFEAVIRIVIAELKTL